jgi:hypothetical protein
MKIATSLILLTALFQIKMNSPSIVVSNDSENILLLGIQSPLTALIENVSKKEVILTTDNGTIERYENNKFYIIPAKVGLATINVCRLIKKDTVIVGKQLFRVHALPSPVVYIGLIKGGPIKRDFLIKQGGIIAKINCCGFDAPVQIKEFSFVVIRDSSSIVVNRNIGPKFTDKTKTILEQSQDNDRLIIYDLLALTPDYITRQLDPIEYTIEK